MNNEDFNKIVEERIASIKSILASKSKEYSSDVDRLHNFKVAARVKNEHCEQALWGMLMKHLVSVMNIVDDPEGTADLENFEYLINEKIGDMINYLILLEALLKERIKK